MDKKSLLTIVTALTALSSAAETAVTDSTATTVRRLNSIEVLGIKQMPGVTGPVTRLSARSIERLGVDAVKDLGEIVPNMYTPSYGSRMTSSIYMRGLGSRIDQAVVGLNIDGVPILNKDAFDTDIPDIASIEVLRGAQSLLNGRNAMAGQVNVYTLSPRDFRGWRARAEYGRFNTTRLSLGYYTRLSDAFYTSLTGQYMHTDGAWTNTLNGSQTGLENAGSVRWKVLFQPSEHHTVTNTASFSAARQSGYPYQSVASGNIAYNDTCYYRRNMFTDGITAAWRGRRVVVTSITSIQYLDDEMTLDQDFLPADYFTLTQRRHELTFTEDLFAKGTRGRYSWLGGVFAFHRHTDMSAPVTFHDTGIGRLIEDKRNQMNPDYPIAWDERTFPLLSDFSTTSRGFALYHESEYSAGAWLFEAGLRWDYEHISCDYRSDADASYTVYHLLPDGSREVYSHMPVDIHDRGRLSQNFNQLLPRVSVSYRYDAGRVTASLARGFKSGGFNTQMFSDVLQQRVMETMGLSMPYRVADIVSYRPESSYNYELSTHNTLVNGRLNLDATAFFISCRNQQLTVFPPGMVTGRIMTNAGRTRSAGLELSASLQPTDRLQFSLSYGYTDAVFRSYNDGRADYRGKRVPYAPAHTLFVTGRWEMPFEPLGIKPSLQLTLRGVGDIQWNEANTLSQPFYLLAGASLTLTRGDLSLRLWGENITDTRYDTFYFMSMGNGFTQRGLPVTAGMTLAWVLGGS